MHKEKIKILLAEDDLTLGMLLVDYLEGEGFDVKLCKDGEKAVAALNNSEFDICLLDIMMPKLDGFSVAKEVRAKSKNIPVIFITAKSLKEDKMKGYELGADDYITKPFDEEELLWKIKTFVRRIPEEKNQSETVAIGKYNFVFGKQLLVLNEKQKRITEKEAEIVKYLSDHQNKLVKREEMLQTLWGENNYFLGRSLDVFITKIRKYLKDDPEVTIENVFGVGFIFNVPDAKHKSNA